MVFDLSKCERQRAQEPAYIAKPRAEPEGTLAIVKIQGANTLRRLSPKAMLPYLGYTIKEAGWRAGENHNRFYIVACSAVALGDASHEVKLA